MRLGLGTAQFGLNYGVSNQSGQCKQPEVEKILSAAASVGVKMLDTAPAYGISEATLGFSGAGNGHFSIVTKTPRFFGKPFTKKQAEIVRNSLIESTKRIGVSTLYCLMVHNCEDLLAPGGELLIDTLQKLKAEGIIERIGISIYNEQEIDQIETLLPVNLIQVPINILDQRLIKSDRLKILKTKGIKIHARSAFLQGLLLMPLEQMPSYFETIRPSLTKYRNTIKEAGLSPVQAAITFLKNIHELDCILVGVNSVREFQEVTRAYNHAPTSMIDFSTFSTTDASIINPGLWRI